MNATNIVQNAVGALFESDDAAGDAVAGLVRTGVLPGSLTVVTHAAGRARQFGDRYHVRVGDHRVTDLAKLGIDDDRAEHFANALGEGVLLVLPGGEVSPERVGVLLRARADLGLANVGGIERVIPLRAETLDVQKAVVVTNEVTVSTEVIKETKSYDVELTREEFVIQRRRVGVEGPGAVETIRIPLRHEEVVLTKHTIVTEEVTVHTEQMMDVEHVEETLRHEVLHVENELPGE